MELTISNFYQVLRGEKFTYIDQHESHWDDKVLVLIFPEHHCSLKRNREISKKCLKMSTK